jgi:hypothetical protein
MTTTPARPMETGQMDTNTPTRSDSMCCPAKWLLRQDIQPFLPIRPYYSPLFFLSGGSRGRRARGEFSLK